MVNALHRNAKSNLTREQVGAVLAAALHGPQVNTYMVPGDFGPRGSWTVDQAALRNLIDTQFRDSRDPRQQVITVLNTGAPTGSARRLAERLRTLGYQNVQVANGESRQDVTTLSGDGAPALSRELGFGQVLAEGGPLTIRLGSDALQ
ncbi:LytR C-terminal domain-containing protein [Deinococcus lacus]|uniref:LytR C-terminal domain-containing protein n=1 Tax=Deinococcus lacus TaxID=392561 RepID=A0ABW1Y9Z7_9DEIO